MTNVAVLFAREDSIYKKLAGADVWDAERDARKWEGGAPVVAHPPCRAWGRMRQFANPRHDEKDLARFAIQQLRKWGGFWSIRQSPHCGPIRCFRDLAARQISSEAGQWRLTSFISDIVQRRQRGCISLAVTLTTCQKSRTVRAVQHTAFARQRAIHACHL